MNAETLKGHLDDRDRLVLSALEPRPAHGYAIAAALRSGGDARFDRPDGALYLALHRLERAALLASRWSDVDGRRRRVYQLTESGHHALVTHQSIPIVLGDRFFPSLSKFLVALHRKGSSMTTRAMIVSLSFVFVAALSAQSVPNFSGRWVLNTAKGKNLGMMTALKDTVTITQTAKELVIHDTSSFQGRDNTRELRYDLSGKAMPNDGPMGDHNETVAKWVDGRIVATWTREGAVAGTKSVMTETRSLSSDGKTMTLESVRGENPAVVMVFEKQ
jgi:PadR family transcriptional regulator PadR